MFSRRDAFIVWFLTIAVCGAGCEKKNTAPAPMENKPEVNSSDKTPSGQPAPATGTAKEVSSSATVQSAPSLPKSDPPKQSSEAENPVKGESPVVTPMPNAAKEAIPTDYDGLVGAIRRKPWDAATVLALADWLETNDKPRAKLVRLQLEQSPLKYGDPRFETLQEEINALMNEHEKRWSKPLDSLAERARVDFEVGLIDSIQLQDAADGDLAELEKVPELRTLRLESPKLSAVGYERLARLPNIDSLTIYGNSALPKESLTHLEKLAPWVVLDIETTDEDRAAAKEMNLRRMAKFQDLSAEQKHMAGVRFLGAFGSGKPVYGKPLTAARLSQSGIVDDQMPFLAAVPELECVDISQSDVTSKGIAQLAGLKEVKSLNLSDTNVSSIAALKELTKLEHLTLFPAYGIKMGDQGLEGIQNFTNLQDLYLNDESIADATVRRLASMTKLNKLDITVSKLEDENCLAALSGMTDLKTLAFYGGKLSDQALSHLAGLKKLETLGISISRGDGAGFKHLAGLDALSSLSISGDGVTDDAILHLSGNKKLELIMAQTSKITPNGAKKLAANLPRVTIILEEAVVKSPRSSFTFIRRKLNDQVSMLVPEDWEREAYENQGRIHAGEDGWQNVGGWSGSSVGPAKIDLSSNDRFKSAKETMMAGVNTNAHLDPKISKNDVLSIEGSTDTASCIYRNKSGEHLVCAAKVGNRFIMFDCQAPAARFAEFTPLFTYVGQSIRISDDAAKHAQESVEVSADKLRAK